MDISFGAALLLIRGKRRNTEIARRALGPEASTAAVRDFANYFSRVTHDRVPSPGYERLKLFARGLGLATASSLLRQIEALQAGAKPQDDQSTPALKAVDVDQAPTPADIKIAQLTQRIEVLEQTKEAWLEGIATATIADAERNKAAWARDRQRGPGVRPTKSGTRGVGATLGRVAGRENATTKKTLTGKS